MERNEGIMGDKVYRLLGAEGVKIPEKKVPKVKAEKVPKEKKPRASKKKIPAVTLKVPVTVTEEYDWNSLKWGLEDDIGLDGDVRGMVVEDEEEEEEASGGDDDNEEDGNEEEDDYDMGYVAPISSSSAKNASQSAPPDAEKKKFKFVLKFDGSKLG